jgi:hypothetical protein
VWQPEKEEDMAIRLTVRRGDSLWSLAHRYLGSGERYPQIYDFHNQEAARYGLRPIEKPNLIFVGQTILIPPRPKVPKPGSGTKAEGSHWPIPLNLKVTYTIGKDTPPIIYKASYGDYSITTEMSGEIGIENKTPGHFRYVHNYELAMSKDSIQAKQKLRDTTDPALVALTAEPEMMVDKSGMVKIKAPIAANANLGPYTVRVDALTPMHYSGTLEPQTIKGTLELGRSKFKYSADIWFKVDVFWHKKPKGGPEPVKVPEPVKKVDPIKPTNHTSKWDQTVTEKGVVVAVVSLFLYAAYRAAEIFTTKGMARPIIMSPMIHEIDRHNHSRKEA